ncbi:MAG TPA: hypothetical protein VK787_07660 [Puia sp.]|nr:hypothetical protein [Puia sp.]
MKENKIVYRCTLVSAALLIGAAVARGLSVNNIFVAINTGDVNKHFASSVLIDWILSAMLLLLTGIWLLFLSGDLKRLKRKAWTQALLIGLALTIFGTALWFRYPSSIHLPAFSLTGLILLIPLLIFARSFKQ